MRFLYQKILKPILFCLSPDVVHLRFLSLGEFLGKFGWGQKLVAAGYGYRGPDISKTVDGLRYKTPVLLSAGFDYNGRLTQILPDLGFGGEEIGSISLRSSSGNPGQHFWRLPKSKALLVNKGLANSGVDALIQHLQATPRRKDYVLGVSIARTNDARGADDEQGVSDYVQTLYKLVQAEVGDYYTLNISCPNVHKNAGETFAQPDLLRKLLEEIRQVRNQKPVYVKMPINLPWDEFKVLLQIIDEAGLEGVVIGNLNKDKSGIPDVEIPSNARGNLSGAPCRELSTNLIQKTKEAYGDRFTVIGVGGIQSPTDAREKFAAGADLIQLITGMIMTGPQLVREICEDVARDGRD